MTCASCNHPEHAPNPCATCAAEGKGACWTGVTNVRAGEGGLPTGEIELATGIEKKPCMTCRSFFHDKNKLIRHLLRRGLKPDEQGIFETPIARDFPDRKSLRLDPRTCGFCNREGSVVDMLATCENYRPVRTSSELESRIKS